MSDLLPVSDEHPSPPAPSGWTERAACRGEDPDLFYPPEGERGGNLALRELAAALRLRKIPELDDSGWLTPEVWHGKSDHELELEAAESYQGDRK